MKIRPKTKDWLKGLQEEIARKRDSVASVSPTANSCLLEENFDFTSLDYESEGEQAREAFSARWRGGWVGRRSPPNGREAVKSPSETHPASERSWRVRTLEVRFFRSNEVGSTLVHGDT